MSRDLYPRAKESFLPRYLEAVIVCVDYSDFLEFTLPRNLNHFDHVVVVTSFQDHRTASVARHNNIEVVKTDCFYENGDSFNKAAAINLGLAHLRFNDWVLHLDADILLPAHFRSQLWNCDLDSDSLYGADRMNVIGRKHAEELIRSEDFSHLYRNKFLVKLPEGSNLGARLVHREMGYCPIGFFQLWNGSYMNKHQLRYPQNQRGAERSDVLHALQWPRGKRHLLPVTAVWHLESEESPQGVNWHGRVSAPF